MNVVAYDYNNKNETSSFSDIIVVGVMNKVGETEKYRDFEVHVAIVLDESIDIYIDEENILRLHNFHGLEYGSVIVAFLIVWNLYRIIL